MSASADKRGKAQGRAASTGSSRRGGATLKFGGEVAQLAVQSAQALAAIRVHRRFIRLSDGFKGSGGGGVSGVGTGLGHNTALGLGTLALSLERARAGVGSSLNKHPLTLC